MKTCKSCKQEKDDSAFYSEPTRKGGLSYSCRDCNKSRCKASYSTNKVKHKKYWAKVFKENPRKRKEFRLRQVYNMSLSEFDDIIALQDNKCALCKCDFTESNLPCIDHDHACCAGEKSCGKCIRGLLCHMCNHGLGHFRDNPDLCRLAADYLEIYKNLLTFQKTHDTVLDEGKTK